MFLWNYFEFRPVVLSSYMAEAEGIMWNISMKIYSAKQNPFCNFDSRQYEKHFCEIILNLSQGFRSFLEMSS